MNLRSLKYVTGSALALAVALVAAGSPAAPSLEPRIAFWRWDPNGADRIHSVRPDGSRRRLVTRGRFNDSFPAWSADGRRLAFMRNGWCGRGPCAGIWTSDANGRGARRLVRGELQSSPSWSPDGRTISFTRGGVADRFSVEWIYTVGTDGRGGRQLTRDHYDEDPAWSPDGRTIAFSRLPPLEYVFDRSASKLMLVNGDGSGLRPFPGGIAGREPAWSPDGRRLAFVSHQHRNGVRCIKDDCWTSGELYVVNADGTGLRRLSTTSADERSPTWSPDGKWIAYSRGYRVHGFRRYRIFRIRPNGEGRRLVAEMDRSLYDPAWRPR